MNKPFAITLDVGSSLANKTGSWRTERPVYRDLLPPCNNACPAGENIQAWLYNAEEGGAAKVFMARDGLFKDCDVCLHWHPGSRNAAGDQSCLARIAVKFRFHGRAAHAAGSPERGRSALDALTLTMRSWFSAR